jgi:hypothetical protein
MAASRICHENRDMPTYYNIPGALTIKYGAVFLHPLCRRRGAAETFSLHRSPNLSFFPALVYCGETE